MAKAIKLSDQLVAEATRNAVDDKQYLLAYSHEKKSDCITLLAVGSHEVFYRDQLLR